MFTGIIEETGVVERIKSGAKSIELTVRSRQCARGLKVGDSVAVNGCCLTAVGIASRGADRLVRLDLLKETWKLTNIKDAGHGSAVNLERPVKAGGRMDGHFVTGHIDGTGVIRRWEKVGTDHVLEIAAPASIMNYVVFKGSIAVDGISLTVAAVRKGSFRVWIIPHTFKVTALRERAVGDLVNLESDILGKYVWAFANGGKNR